MTARNLIPATLISANFGLLGLLAFTSACGDDKKSGDFSSISAAISSPSGTVSTSEDAKGIATAFQSKVGGFQGGLGAPSGYGQGETVQSCPAGGDFVVKAEGNQKSSSAEIHYNNCCWVADCCYDGEAHWYYSSAPAMSTYSLCGDWDLSAMCGGQSANLEFEGCFGTDGNWYLIEYNGESYAVSGTFNDGSGAWKIKSANGTWDCTANNGSGSCTDGTTTITW